MRFRVLNLGQGDVSELLRKNGALVDVTIKVPSSYASQLQNQGQSIPPAQTVKGLVDTGASISTVSETVVQAAGLQKIGSVPIGGVGGTSERALYAASFGLPNYGVVVEPVEVAGVTIPQPGVDILVGRDILKALHLDYEGPAGTFDLTQKGTSIPAGVTSAPGGLPTAAWLAIAGAVGAAAVGTLLALDVF